MSSAAPRASTAACTACRRACCRWRSGTRRASASTSGWPRSPRAPPRSGCSSPTRRRPQYREALAAQMRVARRCWTASASPASTCASSAAARSRACVDGAAAAGARPAQSRLRAEPALRDSTALQRPSAATVGRAGDLRRAGRQAEHARARASSICCAGAAAPRRDRAAGAGAPFGSHRRRHRRVHALPGCVGACPEAALADNAERPQLQLHREELRPVRPVREHLPGRRHRAAAAPAARRRRQGAAAAARAQRGRALSLRPLRQAVRHLARDRDDGRASCPATPMFQGARRRAAADVRRLPRHRHPQRPGRNADHRPVSTDAVRCSPGLAARRRRRRAGPRRGLRPAGAALSCAARRRRCMASSRSPSPKRRLERRAFSRRSWGELVAAARRLDRDAIGRRVRGAVPGHRQAGDLPLRLATTSRGKLNEKPLVALRHALRALGLASDADAMRDRGPHRQPVRGDALPDRRRRRGDEQPRCAAPLLRRSICALGRRDVRQPSKAHPGRRFLRARWRASRATSSRSRAQAFDLLDA